MFLINYFFDLNYKPMPKYEAPYLGATQDLKMNTRANNSNVENMSDIIKMLSVKNFDTIKKGYSMACDVKAYDPNIAHNKSKIDDQWKLNHDKIPSSSVLLKMKNRGWNRSSESVEPNKTTYSYDRNGLIQTTIAGKSYSSEANKVNDNPIASCEDKIAKLKMMLSSNKKKSHSDEKDSTTFCDKISNTAENEDIKPANVDNQLKTCINVDNIQQDEPSLLPDNCTERLSEDIVLLNVILETPEPKNSSSDECQIEEDMSNSANYEDIEDECYTRVEKKKSKKSAKHKRSRKNKNDKNDKSHNKHRSDSPIYFCTETVKLYTKKKPHAKKNSKKKSEFWLNSLVGKYVSFLNKAVCKNSRLKDVPRKSSETSFDEINGTFYKSSSDCDSGDDAFTVVFSDSPASTRNRNRFQQSSECDSEDSFVICFENDCDSVDGGFFTNDDDFERGSWTSDSDGSDDSDREITLVPQLKGCMKKSRSRGSSPNTITTVKKVSFDPKPPEIHKIIAWKFAYHQARIGPWQDYARDSKRFKQRIIDMSVSLDWVLRREHRSRVYFQRFRPILMRQIREEKEAKKKETERLKIAEQERLSREEEEKRSKIDEEEKLKAENKEEQQIINVDECLCKDIQHKCDNSELIQVN